MTTRTEPAPEISVILPCYNEEGCIAPVTEEILQVLATIGARSEVLLVDDGSKDGTLAAMDELKRRHANVRVLRHSLNCGQSAASATGFAHAQGDIVVILDSDGQHDPADLPVLLRALEGVDAACGVRRRREDSWVRRVSSKIANGYRNWITGDRVRDAGCAFRAIRREALREVPVFNGMHRFLPTLLRLQGYRVVEVEVNHRPRRTGISKYGIGNRLFRGIADCFAVRWWSWRAVPGRRVLPEQEGRAA